MPIEAMLHVASKITKHFQRFPAPPGDSVQHDCNMRRASLADGHDPHIRDVRSFFDHEGLRSCQEIIASGEKLV